MDNQSALYLLIGISAINLLLFVGKTFLDGYLKRKGENHATREDIENLLEQVRRTTDVAEQVKASIGHDYWTAQRAWEAKKDLFQRLMGLCQKLTACSTEKHFVLNVKLEGATAKVSQGEQVELERIQEQLRETHTELLALLDIAPLFVSPDSMKCIDDAVQVVIKGGSLDYGAITLSYYHLRSVILSVGRIELGLDRADVKTLETAQG